MKVIRIAMPITASIIASTLFVLGIQQRRFQQRVAHLWHNLEAVEPSRTSFSPDMVAHLPEPVQRYFLRAIKPGTPLASSVSLKMSGLIRLGTNWHPFTAAQVIGQQRGFVWKADTRMGQTRLQGADYYSNGVGRMRFVLFNLLPVVDTSSADVAQSARGRLAGEHVWLPSALLPQHGVTWEVQDDEHISATLPLNGTPINLMLTIDAHGSVCELILQRWHSEQRAYVPFGLTARRERTFGGYTIPSQLQAGWWYGTSRYQEEGEFFRCTIDEAHYT
jgi:hypothetical protein